MKDKILSALKKGVSDPKTGKTSINDKTLNAYVELISAQITDESQIETAAAPHIAFLNEVQGNINSVAAEAARKAKEAKPQEPQTPQVPVVEPQTEEMPKWAKTIFDKLESIEGTKVHESQSAKLIAALKEKKVPESYYQPALAGRKFEKDEEVDAMVEAISTNFTKFQQDFANAAGGVPPESGNSPQENADAKAVADLISSGTKEIQQTKN